MQDLATRFGTDLQTAAAIVWRLGFAILFTIVLLAILWLAERALKSPWGRMMRAIRDNRDAAEAMGKDVTRRHLQVFVLGSAVVGVAGAMLVTLDGQFTPSSYNPLRYTFLIWVMVIVGGSGNNWGAVLGGFLIWYVWVMAEPAGNALMAALTAGMDSGELVAGPPARGGAAPAAVPDGADPALGAALRAARPDPRDQRRHPPALRSEIMAAGCGCARAALACRRRPHPPHTSSGRLTRGVGSEANSTCADKGLEGPEGVWKLAGKRPYELKR